MPKNRDYTGLLRTPPSLAWLIREKARVRGRLERLEKALSALPAEIAQVQAEIAALDAVIPRHEVKIDPQAIQGVKTIRPPVLPYGVMTRRILEALRNSKGKPLYSTEIALSVARSEGLDLDAVRKSYLVNRVSRRLKKLGSDGFVLRHHDVAVGNNAEGMWSLPVDHDD